MKKGTTKFYLRLIILISIISALPIILVGSFSYIKASNALYEKVMEEKTQSIYQINTNVEQVLKTVDHSLTYFINSSFFKETIKEPMDAIQFQLYRQIKQELNHLQTFDTGVEDVLILSLEGNWVINNRGLYRTNPTEINQEFAQYFDLPLSSMWILDNNNLVMQESPYRDSCTYNVSLVKKLPLNFSTKNGLAIVSIPTCNLAKVLSGDSETETLMILDNDYRIIAHNNLSLIGESFSNERFISEIKEKQIKPVGQYATVIDQSNYTVTYRKSDYNGWLYLSVISNNTLKKETTPIGLFTLTICLIVLFLSLLLSWIGSRHIYRPINDLYNSIVTTFKGNSTTAKQSNDEFEFINDRIHHMLDQNNELESKLQRQVEQLKHLFITRLLDGHLSDEELKMKYLSYKYPETWNHLCVLTLQIDSLERTKYIPEQSDLLLFTINTIAGDIIPKERRLTPVLRRDVQITIIVSDHETTKEFEAFVHEMAQNLQNKVKEELELPVSIGVSQPFTKLSQSREAYQQGVEVLKYRLKFGSEAIIHYKDVDHGNSLKTYFPENIKNELFDVIKLGEREKVEETLNLLIENIFSKDLNTNQYQISLLRLLNDLILLMQTLGVELENLDDKKSLFDQLFELKTVNEIEIWFKETIVIPLVTSLEERINSQYKNISDQIIHIIQQEYDSDISLEAIAERLHYNPNYLSSIFRKETNISFSEYISMYRLNMAKKWLVESDLSIKDIAEKFHYNNSQNFIRSFKKKEGLTPGKYRELHSTKKFD
ncbi:AraC family transcriptional regulator [Anaerobacillus sp. CMMVII]|uniref:AraC family transcriptional regulator n=1 Tax=Anaerobacillus sp. CMMVII TaxID=2755588 RepID=UPI0021B7D9EF|nr:AraC family transcriptional regulator [Anaerobacillus sp. CMMVII]MCT8139615.1 AraC family transcriptional regulator [Anaerobacillus sp. CMMVII]